MKLKRFNDRAVGFKHQTEDLFRQEFEYHSQMIVHVVNEMNRRRAEWCGGQFCTPGIRVSAEKNQKDCYHKERDGLHKMYLIVDESHCYSVRSNDAGQYLVEYSTFLGHENRHLFNNVTSSRMPKCDLTLALPFFMAIEKLSAML